MPSNFNIEHSINEIGAEIDSILENRDKEKYFESILLLYSLIEDLLKWSVFVKVLVRKENVDELPSKKEFLSMYSFCKNLSWYTALNIGLSVDLIDFDLYRRVDKMRRDRNDIIHKLWVHKHRKNFSALRRRLEGTTRVSKQVVKIVNQLADESGAEELYNMILA